MAIEIWLFDYFLIGFMPKTKFKILFIDDEPDACRLFKKLVERLGFTVFTAVNAAEGYLLYKKKYPHIVFLDLKMPGIDGITLLRKIKRINPKQIVIILTGYGDLSSVKAAMRLGASDYVSKPLKIEAILNSIKDAITNA